MALKITIVPHVVQRQTEIGAIDVGMGQSYVYAQPDGGQKRHIGWLYDRKSEAHRPHCALTLRDLPEDVVQSLRPLIEEAAGFPIGEIISPHGVGPRPNVPGDIENELVESADADV